MRSINKVTVLVFVLTLFVSLTSFNVHARDIHVFPAELIRVVDGDTMDMRLDMSLGLFMDVRVRVADYDAPETWRPKTDSEREHGENAKLKAIQLLNKPFLIKVKGWGVFNRVVGDIILHDDRDYATVMSEEGYDKLPIYTDKE